MKATPKARGILPTSYTGYSKTKRYRVNIQPLETLEEPVFTYYSDMQDLKTVIDSYIEDLSQEEDFQIFVKLNLNSGDENYIDVKTTVTFENGNNLFYPPEPVNIYTKNGTYSIVAKEEIELCVGYTAVIQYEEYPTKILEVMDSLFDKNGVSTDTIPIKILLLCFDFETYLWEMLSLRITVDFYPNEEVIDVDLGQKNHVLQFKDFATKSSPKGGVIKKIWDEL